MFLLCRWSGKHLPYDGKKCVLLIGEEALSIDLECEFDDNRSGASDSGDASDSEDPKENWTFFNVVKLYLNC